MKFLYEKDKIQQGYAYVIGCDEVGRGCLAGPVVAAAVALDLRSASARVGRDGFRIKDLREVRDSKLLSAEKRQELEPIIKENAIAWSIAEVSSEEIDEINIHNASLLAMRKAVEKLRLPINSRLFLSVDGKFKVPGLFIEQESIIGGDNKVLSIAAASIIAKVYRDELMQRLHMDYPAYNLRQHKGYATAFHRKVIVEQGLSPIHRLSFCQNLSI